MIWHTTSQVSSSHLSLMFLFPLKASAFTSTRSPGFKFTVHLSVIVPFLSVCLHCWLGLHLLQGSPQSILDGSYIFVHMIGGGLSHRGLTAAKGGEEKVNWEPRPMSKHQIVWTIPINCGTGGIIGVHFFSQMRWPVGFLIFSPLPNHVHNLLVWSLYQTIGLWVVGHGPYLFYTKDLAHFLNHTTHEASTSITQEPGQGPKDRDVT